MLVILLFWVNCFASLVCLVLVIFLGLAILVLASGLARVGLFAVLVGVGYVSF